MYILWSMTSLTFLCSIHLVFTAPSNDYWDDGEEIGSPIDNGFKDEEAEESAIDTIIKVNEGEKSSLFEGDINVEEGPEGVVTPFSFTNGKLLKKELRRHQEFLWIDRVVPYEISKELKHAEKFIKEAFDEISKNTCIKFVKRTKEDNWVVFVDKKSCYSTVGRLYWKKGSQDISIGRACVAKGTILHELLHALGVWHEQSRADRDGYVEVFWENIRKGEEHNFGKHNFETSVELGSEYDYESIMHYGKHSFSKNGKVTLRAINNPKRPLGQRKGLSAQDIIQLNRLYHCEDVGNIYTKWSSWSECSADYKCQRTRQRFCSNYDEKKCPEANKWGVHSEFKKCSVEECYRPIAGHWNRWSAWSACDKTCGVGTKTRKRQCDDPEPRYGGKKCFGDITSTTKCQIVVCGIGKDDCLFDEQQMCFWEDESKEFYHWQRHHGRTPTSNTGPDADFSTGKGSYLFAEASSPAQENMKADLLSKIFPKTSSRCMTYYYSMHGISIGTLKVSLIHFNANGEAMDEEELWEKRGPQGAGWQEGKLNIKSATPYKIKIQAIRSKGFHGDIALDDILFEDKECPPKVVEGAGELFKLCGVKVKAIGCYKEQSKNRVMRYLLDSHRGPDVRMGHGIVVKWNDYTNSINKLFCDCVKRASEYGMKYFGLQYYGECWSNGQDDDFARYGSSKDCINGNFKACEEANQNEVCIGKKDASYTYELVE